MNEALYDDEYEGRAHVLDDKLRDTEWLAVHMDIAPDHKEIRTLAHGALMGSLTGLGPQTYLYHFIAEAYAP